MLKLFAFIKIIHSGVDDHVVFFFCDLFSIFIHFLCHLTLTISTVGLMEWMYYLVHLHASEAEVSFGTDGVYTRLH